MKKFISGFLIGILITLSITTFAAVELNVAPNPFDVLIDGKTADIQGYNINGSTYLKLSDFVEAGLGVNFNKATKQIEIVTTKIQEQKASTTIEGGVTVNQDNTQQSTNESQNNPLTGKDTKPPVVIGNGE